MYTNARAYRIIIIFIERINTPTNKVKSRGQELPCKDGSGNRPDQGDVQPTVDVCQDGRFGRGHADDANLENVRRVSLPQLQDISTAKGMHVHPNS